MDKVNGTVYLIENKINGKKYVGATMQKVEYRWSEHISTTRSKRAHKQYVHKAMEKYGIENFGFRVLEEDINNQEELSKRERFYIDLLDTFGESGYNLTRGGAGDNGGKGVVFQLDRYSGEIIDEFNNTVHAAKELGYDSSAIRLAIRDKVVRNGSIFIRESEYRDLSYRSDMTEYFNSHAVVKLDRDSEEILGYYYNCEDAARDVGLASRASIHSVLGGRQNTAGGYKWIRYSDLTK